ncbi:unnamed protein product, partial [Mesorhabditis spiculigera]
MAVLTGTVAILGPSGAGVDARERTRGTTGADRPRDRPRSELATERDATPRSQRELIPFSGARTLIDTTRPARGWHVECGGGNRQDVPRDRGTDCRVPVLGLRTQPRAGMRSPDRTRARRSGRAETRELPEILGSENAWNAARSDARLQAEDAGEIKVISRHLQESLPWSGPVAKKAWQHGVDPDERTKLQRAVSEVVETADRRNADRTQQILDAADTHVTNWPRPAVTSRASGPGDRRAGISGTHSGSSREAFTEREGTVAGFDVFSGLPETWRTWFPRNLFRALREHLALVPERRIRAPLRSCTSTPTSTRPPRPCSILGDRLVPGSIVVFDEFFNYPGWQQHEYRAWTEFVTRTGISFEYLGYTVDNEQVIVEITSDENHFRTDVPSSSRLVSSGIAARYFADTAGASFWNRRSSFTVRVKRARAVALSRCRIRTPDCEASVTITWSNCEMCHQCASSRGILTKPPRNHSHQARFTTGTLGVEFVRGDRGSSRIVFDRLGILRSGRHGCLPCPRCRVPQRFRTVEIIPSMPFNAS